MCGIAGLINLNHSGRVLNDMLDTMRRRGPDATGIYKNNNCVLLHSRLAIIDPENGKQPMTLRWNNKHYVLVYNGELYNTQELRQELIKLKHIFTEHSDTEVVLHAFAQWGEACVDRMNGIFAFAVWDEQEDRLFLARDRMGVKPLFYKQHDSGFLFASELKTILKYPTVNAEIDKTGIMQIIMLGPGRLSGSGVFKGISEVKPGFCGVYEKGKWKCRQYWHLKDAEHTDSFSDTVEKVRYLVTDSIKRQTVSDVPIGTFLSGGLDSSLISAVCADALRERGDRLKTFSLDFENNDRYFVPGKFQPDSDNRYIGIMEETIQSDHHWTVLNPDDLMISLKEAVVARDLPGMADIDGSLLQFSKDIRKHVKVALSGECADEIFGGYPWYRDPEVRAVEGFPWAQNSIQRSSLLLRHIIEPKIAREFLGEVYQDAINDCDILPNCDPVERRMKQMVNLNQNWFMQTLLDRKDRMSMYSGLEVRVPFCDYRIAEYLYTVPWHMKDHGGVEKGLLRCAMDGVLPKEVLWRKKCPYPKTYDPTYYELVSKVLQHLLDRSDVPLFQIVHKEKLAEFLSGDGEWPWYGQLMKRPQTIAYMLMINMWLEIYNIDITI